MKLHSASLVSVFLLAACTAVDSPDLNDDDNKGILGSGGNQGSEYGSGGTSLGSGGTLLGSGGNVVASGGSTPSGGSSAAGGSQATGGSPNTDFECNDSNSLTAASGAWTDIPANTPCLKIEVPDWAYTSLIVKIQNNDGNVGGLVSVSGSGYSNDFGDISVVNAQTAYLDLERGNSIEAPHAAPYYVKVAGNLSGQQLAWELDETPIGAGGAGGDGDGDGDADECDDSNSNLVEGGTWLPMSTVAGQNYGCFKLNIPDWAYSSVLVKFQNAANIDGEVTVSGATDYFMDFGDIATNATAGSFDLQRSNVTGDTPYYVRVANFSSGADITFELVY